MTPRTTITDNFNRAEADALGTSPEGWSWTETQNDIDIVSNAAQHGAGVLASARAESDLSSDDHYTQVAISCTWSNSFDFAGGAVRFDAAANSFYAGGNSNNSNDTFIIFKVVTGTRTALVSPAGTIDAVATVKIQVDASALELFSETISVATVTDTTFTGQLRAGLYSIDNGGGSTTNNFDNFEASDLTQTFTQTPRARSIAYAIREDPFRQYPRALVTAVSRPTLAGNFIWTPRAPASARAQVTPGYTGAVPARALVQSTAPVSLVTNFTISERARASVLADPVIVSNVVIPMRALVNGRSAVSISELAIIARSAVAATSRPSLTDLYTLALRGLAQATAIPSIGYVGAISPQALARAAAIATRSLEYTLQPSGLVTVRSSASPSVSAIVSARALTALTVPPPVGGAFVYNLLGLVVITAKSLVTPDNTMLLLARIDVLTARIAALEVRVDARKVEWHL